MNTSNIEISVNYGIFIFTVKKNWMYGIQSVKVGS